jgi:hypothetical protein
MFVSAETGWVDERVNTRQRTCRPLGEAGQASHHASRDGMGMAGRKVNLIVCEVP